MKAHILNTSELISLLIFIFADGVSMAIYSQSAYARPLSTQTTTPALIQKIRKVKDITIVRISGTIVNGENKDLDIPCDRLTVTIAGQVSNVPSQIVATGVATGETSKNSCKFALSYTIPKSLEQPKLITGKILIQASGEGYIGKHSIPISRDYQYNVSNPDVINYAGFGGGVSIELQPQLFREFKPK